MPRFEDKTVVVTGAGGGIGKGIAARFAAAGATLVLADRDPAVLDAAEELGAIAVQADITDPDDVARVFAAADRVDVLVNNAGIITISRLEELTLSDWERVLRVNTTGTFLCCQAAAARMREQGEGGRLLNAASGQARQGFIYTPHYAASKFAVVGLTQSLAKELARGSWAATCGRTTTANGAGCWVITSPASSWTSGSPAFRWGAPAPTMTSPHYCSSWPPTMPPTSRVRPSMSTAACS
jgi:NAD(P)-dependent dehydrogenase (short-subunit alcohol dehydrogenase family)